MNSTKCYKVRSNYNDLGIYCGFKPKLRCKILDQCHTMLITNHQKSSGQQGLVSHDVKYIEHPTLALSHGFYVGIN
jgi:hypothetical protein